MFDCPKDSSAVLVMRKAGHPRAGETALFFCLFKGYKVSHVYPVHLISLALKVPYQQMEIVKLNLRRHLSAFCYFHQHHKKIQGAIERPLQTYETAYIYFQLIHLLKMPSFEKREPSL